MNTTRKQIVNLSAEASAFAAVLSIRAAACLNARPPGIAGNPDDHVCK
jgi:hypothetical protein